MKNRIIGVLSLWAREDFAEAALEQADTLCDDVYVYSYAHVDAAKGYEDSSEAIARDWCENHERCHYVDFPEEFKQELENATRDGATALAWDYLTKKAQPVENDIIWHFDADEFYPEALVDDIFDTFANNPHFTDIRIRSWMVGPDWEHYTTHAHTRIYRYWEGRHWASCSMFLPRDPNPVILPKDEDILPMFHYSLFVPWGYKKDYWSSGQSDREKISAQWVDTIFAQYDTRKDNGLLHQLNAEITGNYGYWFHDNAGQNEDGSPFYYGGDHPDVIERKVKPRLKDPRRDFLFKPRTKILAPPQGIVPIPLRTPFLRLQEEYGNKELVGCEIGVNAGENSYAVLANLNMDKMYLIDPWGRYKMHSGYTVPQEELEMKLQVAKITLNRWRNVTEFIRKTSDDAVDDIPDGSLDFVYIDGLHTAEQVKRDIISYYPKVKDGGFIIGHDYIMDEIREGINEILMVDYEHHSFRRGDWWFKKDSSKKQLVTEEKSLLVVSPWLGEFGYEIASYIPFARAKAEEARKRNPDVCVVAFAERGKEFLYEDFSDYVFPHTIPTAGNQGWLFNDVELALNSSKNFHHYCLTLAGSKGNAFTTEGQALWAVKKARLSALEWIDKISTGDKEFIAPGPWIIDNKNKKFVNYSEVLHENSTTSKE
jgi:hypothetical protein